MKKHIIFLLIVFVLTGTMACERKQEETSNNFNEEYSSKAFQEDKIIDNQETLNELLKHIGFAEEALSKFGAESPEEALNLWLEGMKSGNGVLQYAVMNPMLQQEFKTYLQNEENLTWDTRMEELTLDKYEVVEYTNVSEKIKIYQVRFDYFNLQGELKETFNKITLVEEGGKWSISLIR